jgi:hypothetical protein
MIRVALFAPSEVFVRAVKYSMCYESCIGKDLLTKNVTEVEAGEQFFLTQMNRLGSVSVEGINSDQRRR